MLDDVIGYLACPRCGAAMARAQSAVRCAAGHSFDIARQGYVSLLPPGGHPAAGDSAAMVAARADFLAAGHYAGLAAELADVAAQTLVGNRDLRARTDADSASGVGSASGAGSALSAGGCVIDVGAGTGYYLATVLDRSPDLAGLALDASKFALRRAARAHQRIGAVGADAWRRLPVADGAALLALNVFAPRDGAELRRVLRLDGALLVVTPNPDHLRELAEPLSLLSVDPRKEERLTEKLSPYFGLAQQRPYRVSLELTRRDVATLVGMGPSAWHADAATLTARIGELPAPTAVTLSVTLSVFRPARS